MYEVQGPTQGSLVGSRGNAPMGVWGAKPPTAPGLLGFLRPQNASPRIKFSFIFQTISFAAKSVDHDIQDDKGSFIYSDNIFFRIGLKGGRSDFDIKEWFSSAQGCLGDVPPEKLGNFVFLKLESLNEFGEFFQAQMRKISVSSVSRTSCYYIMMITMLVARGGGGVLIGKVCTGMCGPDRVLFRALRFCNGPFFIWKLV